ncbi:hypothetical protein LWI28_017947 [Acer negundo]|uniref:PPM-type phosphatase domain-containing protein n=1 Tax=Acer negundo TaxID=4023 RepID=A0AAD5JPC5_ACENE|nr:hypothetical protein LWI28_017947 [Acer negundo]
MIQYLEVGDMNSFCILGQAFKLRRFLGRGGGSKKAAKRPSWMMPISHGYHVVEDQSFRGSPDDSEYDSVVVQREQIEEIEMWFFGVFDARIGDGVTKYMQSHFFGRNLKSSKFYQSQMRRKSQETMKKAYLGARAKVKESQKEDETWRLGSASVMVINGEKLVIANMGDYRAVVCRGGVAHQIGTGHQQTTKRHWYRRFFSGTKKYHKASELAVGAEKIDSNTEFVLLASTGIWEVMKNQEALSLIRHLEDPQEAAECLAKEALTRMSKSNISCVVIRFD